MYTNYFGIAESPFAITPDPRYLYMSEKHQEALAHLLYGVTTGGGFVVLTGEVGTGKTTISRALMEQLPDHVDAALCLNPRLDEVELLANLCDELKIPYPADSASLKGLVDILNAHLLAAHGSGRHSVLIIDEAQNLSPRVLEQLRLLTNLETSTKKLLQIILIGQPELNDILARPDMRQMAQRITARFHLLPLNAAETGALIAYRLSVVGLDPDVISGPAVRLIHRMSGGVPRLINILCDRCLLAAYARNQMRVDRNLAQHAATEVLGAQRPRRPGRPVARMVGAVAAMVLLGIAGFAAYRYAPPVGLMAGDQRQPAPIGATAATAQKLHEPEPPIQLSMRQLPAPSKPEPVAMTVEQRTDMPVARVVPVTISALAAPPVPITDAADDRGDGAADNRTAPGAILTIALAQPIAESDAAAPVLSPDGVLQPYGAEPRSGQVPPNQPRWSSAAGPEVGWFRSTVAPPSKVPVAGQTEVGELELAAITPAAGGPSTDPAADLAMTFDDLLSDPDIHGDLITAVRDLFAAWGIDISDTEAITPCAVAREHGLQCLRRAADWASLRQLRRPALVRLGRRDGPGLHAVITGVDGDAMTIAVDGGAVAAEVGQFVAVWSGDFLLLWRPPVDYKTLIRLGMQGPDVAWLRDRMAALGGQLPGDDRAPIFDGELQSAVVDFQRQRGLMPDGIVGPLTLIELNTALGHPDVPMLTGSGT